VAGIQDNIDDGASGAVDFFCTTDGSISWGNPASINTVPPPPPGPPLAAPTTDSGPPGVTAAQFGATSGGDTGAGPVGTIGTNGLEFASRLAQLGDNMLESSCHVLQGIPYDPLTGVLRALGPLYSGTFIVDGDSISGPMGLREVPEPGTLLLLGAGLAGLATLRRRRA
jgi:hypothetical protein